MGRRRRGRSPLLVEAHIQSDLNRTSQARSTYTQSEGNMATAGKMKGDTFLAWTCSFVSGSVSKR